MSVADVGKSVSSEPLDISALSGKVVLVIDDDPDVRQATERHLAEMHCRVVTAESGRGGLSALERELVVDAVIVDFAMPGMNGLEVADEIAVRRPILPVIIVTGYADINLDDGDGRFQLLKKPFRRSDLAAALSAALRQNSVSNLLQFRPGSRT